jgi:UPF0271 protein
MNSLVLNCDLGEGTNNEKLLMPYIQLCNIACGGHAGDENTINNVVTDALKYNVKIGAHPSYPDLENFGRKSLTIKHSDLKLSIINQINFLNTIVNNLGGSLHHIKPHGALYNDIAKNKTLAMVFLEAILPFKKNTKLLVPFGSEIEKCALKNGFSILYEAFADRNYNNDLSLVSRNDDFAVLTNVDEICKHVLEIVNTHKVTTINQDKIYLKADTFCVHSDTKNAAEIVKKLHEINTYNSNV